MMRRRLCAHCVSRRRASTPPHSVSPRRRSHVSVLPPARSGLASITLAVAILAVGCVARSAPTTGPREADSPEPAPQEARKVEAVPSRLGAVRDTLTLSTTLEALHTIEVPTQISGRVSEVIVREGASVRKGDPILRLDNEELVLAVRERELEHHDAVERAATVQLDWEESKQSEAVNELSFLKAEREYQRLERLLTDLGRRPVSEEAVEASRFAMDEARIRRETGLLITQRKDHLRKLAELTVDKTKIAWDRAQLDLDRAVIGAPIDGDVTFLEIRPGEQVNAGAHVVTVVDRGILYCKVRIPQRRLAELSLGQPVEIESETHPGLEILGRVEAILAVVDPIEGTVEARVEVDDPDGVLRPGAFLTARIVLSERPDALLIPKRARLFEGNRSLIFVVRDDHAVRLEVATGLLTDDEVEIRPAVGGLIAGESVVVRGQSRLRDGEAVIIAGEADEDQPPTVETGSEAAEVPAPQSAVGEGPASGSAPRQG